VDLPLARQAGIVVVARLLRLLSRGELGSHHGAKLDGSAARRIFVRLDPEIVRERGEAVTEGDEDAEKSALRLPGHHLKARSSLPRGAPRSWRWRRSPPPPAPSPSPPRKCRSLGGWRASRRPVFPLRPGRA